VKTVEGTVRESPRQVEAELQDRRERVEQPQASTDDTPTVKAEAPRQDRRPDGRTYEERSVEELRERAAELQIEGRSAMTKDELIAALRDHRRSRSANTDAARSQPPTHDRPADRRTSEERSVEELRERAAELQIEGRSSMGKDELIAALRNHRRSRSAGSQPARQDRPADRRPYEDRSIEELRERARELDIEGRSAMSKDELIAALRQQAK
jgi:hypothetical protein